MNSVLVIDDDLGTLDTFRVILSLAGYRVETASTGREGLRLLESERFTLALTDLRMPDLSGLELLAEARERGCQIPIVIMTAWGTSASETASRQLGAKDFVQKPLDSDSLVEVVRKSVEPLPRSTLDLTVSDDSRSREFGYAARRWATVVVAVMRLERDVPTVAAWGAEVGSSTTTLKTWCAAAGVHAGDSLDFARVLRVVRRRAGRTSDWHNDLAVVDPRTLQRLLERSGLTKSEILPNVLKFLQRQRFITTPGLLFAVQAMFDRPSSLSDWCANTSYRKRSGRRRTSDREKASR